MTRADAIAELARRDLEGLAIDERADQFEVMLLEHWSEHPDWASLPVGVRNEFETGQLREAPTHPRYDPVLLVWLRTRYAVATNAYIKGRLASFGLTVDDLVGSPIVCEPCPCCGFRTLSSRGNYEICRVDWPALTAASKAFSAPGLRSTVVSSSRAVGVGTPVPRESPGRYS